MPKRSLIGAAIGALAVFALCLSLVYIWETRIAPRRWELRALNEPAKVFDVSTRLAPVPGNLWQLDLTFQNASEYDAPLSLVGVVYFLATNEDKLETLAPNIKHEPDGGALLAPGERRTVTFRFPESPEGARVIYTPNSADLLQRFVSSRENNAPGGWRGYVDNYTDGIFLSSPLVAVD